MCWMAAGFANSDYQVRGDGLVDYPNTVFSHASITGVAG
jgi:hypothetical protein